MEVVLVYRTGLGKNSHRFLSKESSKPCVIGGVIFDGVPGLLSESDGDVIFHAICNAITSLTHVPILGVVARDLCKKNGITDSKVYLEKALETLKSQKISHVALTLEGKTPRFQSKIDLLRESVASALRLSLGQVGITAISGEGLTDFGCGEGIECVCVLTTCEC